MSIVGRGVLFAVCCLLCDVRGLLCVALCLLLLVDAKFMLYVVCCLLVDVCCVLLVA